MLSNQRRQIFILLWSNHALNLSLSTYVRGLIAYKQLVLQFPIGLPFCIGRAITLFITNFQDKHIISTHQFVYLALAPLAAVPSAIHFHIPSVCPSLAASVMPIHICSMLHCKMKWEFNLWRMSNVWCEKHGYIWGGSDGFKLECGLEAANNKSAGRLS